MKLLASSLRISALDHTATQALVITDRAIALGGVGWMGTVAIEGGGGEFCLLLQVDDEPLLASARLCLYVQKRPVK